MNVCKRSSFVPLAALAAALALTGCKTTGDTAYVPPPEPVQAPGTMYAPRMEVDRAYVSYVESVARRRGVIVRWVNKPVKRHVDKE